MQILTPFAGEMLVLVMLIFLNTRIFFTRCARRDAIALLAPLSVVVMLFHMMAWGIHLTGAALFALTLVTAILNYRSVVRFSQDLFVESYSVKFSVASILLLLASLLALGADFAMRPVRLRPGQYGVRITREYFSCPVASGFDGKAFKEAREITDVRNLALYTFSDIDSQTQRNTVILFAGDVCGETLNYEPYLILLARAGYTVLAADLYGENILDFRNTRLLRRLILLTELFRGERAASDKAAFRESAAKSRAKEYAKIYDGVYNALASTAKERYPEKGLFIVCDSSAALSTEELDAIFGKYFTAPDARAFPRSLNLSDVSDYTTPGFGFVSQTNPAFAKAFLGEERDKTLFAPSYCAYATRRKTEN